MDSKIHTMIMSSILAFSLIAGIPTVFAQNDTGMTSGGGDMGNMTQAQGENMTQAQGGEMGMTDGQNGDDGTTAATKTKMTVAATKTKMTVTTAATKTKITNRMKN